MTKNFFRGKKIIPEIENLTIVLKNIAESNRLKILYLLREKPQCVYEIWKRLKLPQNLVSHHLSVLKKFNLVFSKKKGLKIFYQTNKKLLRKYLKQLRKAIG